MNLSSLKEPFDSSSIEWRLQSCGENNGSFWAICLAYVTNRAIQDRLDEVCGPENWKNQFKPAPDGGILCGISIKVADEWITKWDGAENTAIDEVKGGLSSSMKRAAVQWGIGRYLYKLESNFAEIHPSGKNKGKTKDGKHFKWNPPQLPGWALPSVDCDPNLLPTVRVINEGIQKEDGHLIVECLQELSEGEYGAVWKLFQSKDQKKIRALLKEVNYKSTGETDG